MSNNNYIKLQKDIHENFDENIKKNEEKKQEELLQECLFCFEEVDLKKSFVGCDTCGKVCHDKCYLDWFKRKNMAVCISCQQPTLVLSETKTTMMSKCLHSIFGVKQKFYKKFYRLG